MSAGSSLFGTALDSGFLLNPDEQFGRGAVEEFTKFVYEIDIDLSSVWIDEASRLRG
jgi:hypothetical protein